MCGGRVPCGDDAENGEGADDVGPKKEARDERSGIARAAGDGAEVVECRSRVE